MLSNDGWGDFLPSFILSVAGSAHELSLPDELRNAIKGIILNASRCANTWILTSGTDYGVMKLIGEAADEEYRTSGNEVVLMGIASWGKVARRKELIIKVGYYIIDT